MKYLSSLVVVVALSCAPICDSIAGHHAHAAEPVVSTVKVRVTQLSERVYVLQGKGGNVGLFVGESEALLIDNDYIEVTPAILEEVKNLSDKPIKFLVNTHWHGDHTGGNQRLGSDGTLIFAHDNVRKRLSEDNYIAVFDMTSKAAADVALPVITYSEQASLHIGGQGAHVIHVKNAHTDGDSIIYFSESNIIHAGDVYFNGFYPFIDASTGGTLNGMIAAVEVVLGLSDDKTQIIPGHGSVSNKAELQDYRDMLVGVRDAVRPMITAGKTLEEIKSAKPLAPFNAVWGDGFLSPDVWVGIVYDAMK